MYTKILDNGNIQTLSFITCDFYYVNKLGFGSGFQRCEDKEQLNKFNRVLYTFGGTKQIRSYILLEFDFVNSCVTVNGKKLNVVADYEFTFKKTRGNNILAIGGIDGFYKTVVSFMNYDSAFNSWFMHSIESMFKTKAIEIPIN